MKQIKIFIYLLITFALLGDTASCRAVQDLPLIIVKEGKSDYEIYISSEADSSLLNAVLTLRKTIYRMTGADLLITHKKRDANQILVGDIQLKEILDFDYGLLIEGGYVIQSENSNLTISGLNQQGAKNGVYAFMERYLGCHYYSSDAVIIPESPNIVLNPINVYANPTFRSRFLHSYVAFSFEYCDWNRLNYHPRDNSFWTEPWIHSTTKYIDPKRYFKSNPEFFMLWNGQRNPKDIDFSNENVFQILTNKIRQKLRENPAIKYIGVSQADLNKRMICQCNECKEIKERGGPSAVIVEFVNRVAREFPHRTIVTLAYNYSRTPPRNIKIEKNVLVIYCNREPTRSTNVYQRGVKDRVFYKELLGWKKLTSNIMVWDYAANFSYPIAPYPNWYFLQNTLRTYADLGIELIFVNSNPEQGSEFQELRSYLLSKLMWNPFINADSLITDFLNGYYGPAAPYIHEYMKSVTGGMNDSLEGGMLNARNGEFINYLPPGSLARYEQLFKEARASVKDNSKLVERVDRVQQSLRFVKLELYQEQAKKKRRQGSNFDIELTRDQYLQILDEFTRKAKKYKTTKISPTHRTPDKYRRSKIDAFRHPK